MSEKNIFIFSGPIHSGKTTKLINWGHDRKDVSGILSPIISGKRVFMDAATKEIFPMEAASHESDLLDVGQYIFSATAFNRAKEILLSAYNQKEGWLIIDEVGPLELRGEGFHDVVKEILTEETKLQVVLVVRETLVDAVVKFFGIETYEKFGLRKA